MRGATDAGVTEALSRRWNDRSLAEAWARVDPEPTSPNWNSPPRSMPSARARRPGCCLLRRAVHRPERRRFRRAAGARRMPRRARQCAALNAAAASYNGPPAMISAITWVVQRTHASDADAEAAHRRSPNGAEDALNVARAAAVCLCNSSRKRRGVPSSVVSVRGLREQSPAPRPASRWACDRCSSTGGHSWEHPIDQPPRRSGRLTIAEFAEASGFDLVIVESQCHGAASRLVMASVAAKGLALCRTPVLPPR